MLRQLITNDVITIKRHIPMHKQGNGAMVVARIAGRPDTPQVDAVREEQHPVTPDPEQQALRQLSGMPLLPSPPKRLEVQLDPDGHQPWHIAQVLYLKIEEEEV